LGLSSYEAAVFVALQRLGDGTAQEIAHASEVPRSQVYGAADQLAERGLIEQIESSPKRYRPVSLDAARQQLSQRLEREQDRAFETLEEIRGEAGDEAEGTEIATLRGRHPIQERVAALVSGATERVMYVAPAARQVEGVVADALQTRAREGVDVVVATEEALVRDRFADDPVRVVVMDDDMTEFTGRTLLVDETTVLLSVASEEGTGGDETALWTADTSIGRILGQFISAGMERGMERQDEPPDGSSPDGDPSA
jgi:sugar-specific transcriptional regulator TrmB